MSPGYEFGGIQSFSTQPSQNVLNINCVHAYFTLLKSLLSKLFVLISTYNADTFFIFGDTMSIYSP